jgi:hypothetical protein
MGTALRLLEALLLAAMGLFMASLAMSDTYWQFLNPRYAWLTLTAGAVIVLLGAVHLFHRGREGQVSQVLALAVFLGLAIAAANGPHLFAGPQPEFTAPPRMSRYTGGSLTRAYDDSLPAERAVETLDGREYTRMNLAELLAGEGGWARKGDRVAVQGRLLRTPEMDRAGYVAVARLYIFCCFADAVGVVAMVRVDDPQAYRPGSWVRVLGMLQPDPPFPDRTLAVAGALTTARSDLFAIGADAVDEVPVEGVPFILEVCKTKPFAY